ncbi:MAG: ATP-binding cassette domain-containing protein [Acidimicrobiia bacterium]|nr:ATP-binding cassette domain-containing protein [Acidimicrobiia bacterium]
MHPIVELQQVAAGSLRQVDLVVAPGERIGVIGRPGSGKSGLVEVLVGARRPDSGRIRRNGADVTDDVATGASVRGVGWISQRPRPFRSLTVYENVLAAAFANLAWSRRVAEAHARRAVVRTGLARRADESAGGLDIDAAKRLEVARAIAAPRSLVVVDQLSDGLDANSRAELTTALIDGLDVGAALVWADVVETPPMATDRLIVLELGRIIDEGPPQQVLAGPTVRDLHQHVAEPAPTPRRPPQIARVTPHPADGARARDADAASADAVEVAPLTDPPVDPPAISAQAWTAPRRGVPIIAGVELDVDTGELVVIEGRPGAGKSVLLRSLVGLVDAAGRLLLEGVDVSGHTATERVRLGLHLVPQHGGFVPSLDVDENLALARGAHLRRRWTRAAVYDLFPGLYNGRHLCAGDLPPLERRALAIARSLLGQPSVLLVDEVGTGLPERSVRLLASTLAELAGGLAVVVTDQPGGAAAELADRRFVLSRGRLVPTEGGSS